MLFQAHGRSRRACSENLPAQTQVVETHGDKILQRLFEREPAGVVRILDSCQALPERGTIAVESIHPGIEQFTVAPVVTGSAAGGELLRLLPRRIGIVAIRAGEPPVVRIGGPGKSLRSSLQRGLLLRVARAAFMRQRPISPLLPAVTGGAGYGGMPLVQRKGGMPVMVKHQATAGPSRLRVAGAARGTHLAGVRVGVARLAILLQAGELCVREPVAVGGDVMAPVARHVRMLAPERKRRVGPVKRRRLAPGPALFRVALVAGLLKLSGVRVGVAISTGSTDVKQADLHVRACRRSGMTFLTVEPRVLAHERELAVATVIESQMVPPPALHRMTFKAMAGAGIVVRVVVATGATRMVEPEVLHPVGRMRAGLLCVTLLARHRPVLAIEREVGIAVVERLSVQRYQGGSAAVLRMALPARTGEVAVHTRPGGHAFPDPGVADQALLRGRRRRQQMATITVPGAPARMGLREGSRREGIRASAGGRGSHEMKASVRPVPNGKRPGGSHGERHDEEYHAQGYIGWMAMTLAPARPQAMVLAGKFQRHVAGEDRRQGLAGLRIQERQEQVHRQKRCRRE